MPALVELLTARAEGNPFYLEELLNYIGGQQIDVGDSGALAAIELPESLHSLILSRVDTLPEAPRRTIKVASVVGRGFDVATLVRVYPELGSAEEVGSHLRRLKTLDLVALDRGDDSYLFKHAVTQEVTYESMPYSFRAMLHERVGADIEATQPDAVRPQPRPAREPLLALREHGEEEGVPRARGRGGEGELRERGRDRLPRARGAAPRPAGPLARVARGGGGAEVLGDWAAARGHVPRGARARRRRTIAAVARGAWTHTSLADLFRKRGELDEASTVDGPRARERFEEIGDREGLGRALQLSGTIAAMHGDFDAARPQLEASLEIRRELGDAAGAGALLSNLASWPSTRATTSARAR